eukprot:TRINITY_DN7089_c0_g1_i1.p1 TRINITY_DN7089_c0_g1~~TRINITY_DN7089_c0_g1_i1.p1  ORF type:complete len:446 (+),score=77.29 TRINITY_DN7089_c0_g1_i1:78-1415(+)
MQPEEHFEDCCDLTYSDKNAYEEMDTYQTDQIWTDDQVSIRVASEDSLCEEPVQKAGRPSASSHLISLERDVVKDGFHCWVVRQELDGTCSSFSLGSFTDFFEFLNANVRSPTTAHAHGHKRTRREPTPFHWFDIQGLTADEIRQLGKLFMLHELTIEDMFTEDSPEKLERFGHYKYALLMGQWPSERGTGWDDSRISCLTLTDCFISIHNKPFVALDELLRRVRKEVIDSRERNRYSKHYKARIMNPTWLFYCYFDGLVDALIPRVARLWDAANEVDELILQLATSSPELDDATRIMARTRKHINELRRLLVLKESIIKENKLYKQPQYRDVLDHINQMLGRLDSSRDILVQASSNYLAGVSVQAAIGANKTNEAMRKMSFLAFLFVPMTLITSLFGMNVEVPWQKDGKIPFYGILCSFFGLTIAILVLYRRYERRERKSAQTG